MTIVSVMELGLLTREKADEQWVSEYLCDSVCKVFLGRSSSDDTLQFGPGNAVYVKFSPHLPSSSLSEEWVRF